MVTAALIVFDSTSASIETRKVHGFNQSIARDARRSVDGHVIGQEMVQMEKARWIAQEKLWWANTQIQKGQQRQIQDLKQKLKERDDDMVKMKVGMVTVKEMM